MAKRIHTLALSLALSALATSSVLAAEAENGLSLNGTNLNGRNLNGKEVKGLSAGDAGMVLTAVVLKDGVVVTLR